MSEEPEKPQDLTERSTWSPRSSATRCRPGSRAASSSPRSSAASSKPSAPARRSRALTPLEEEMARAQIDKVRAEIARLSRPPRAAVAAVAAVARCRRIPAWPSPNSRPGRRWSRRHGGEWPGTDGHEEEGLKFRANSKPPSPGSGWKEAETAELMREYPLFESDPRFSTLYDETTAAQQGLSPDNPEIQAMTQQIYAVADRGARGRVPAAAGRDHRAGQPARPQPGRRDGADQRGRSRRPRRP